MSPYRASISELARQFATSAERKAILTGLLNYRHKLKSIGFTSGFQWFDGSFLEDCETQRSRAPADIDIVSFAHRPVTHATRSAFNGLWSRNQDLFSPPESKRLFLCDAYFVDLDLQPTVVVDRTRFWFGLFSHTKVGETWKGIVQVPLHSDDSNARKLLV